jgi:hypothetical protein
MVLIRKFFAAVGGAFALAMTVVHPAAAQDEPSARPAAEDAPRANGGVRGEQVLPGRIGGREPARQQNARRSRQQAQPAAPTAEEIVAGAQATATAAGLSCQVTEATSLGFTAEQAAVYEAVCATGPGYILVASTPPLTGDCVLLASQAATVRASDPAADVGQQCAMPANTDVKAVVGAYAREAGVTCTVDDALAIGRTSAGNLLYEVGCQNEDGYWLEKTDAGWTVTACWEIANQADTCRFSTPAESNSAWKSVLAGTDAAACDVQQTRLMGTDAARLKIYEIKCASGDGYLARVGADRLAQRVHTCADAVNIGGGCQIGVAPAATTVEAPAAAAPNT